MDWLIDSIPFLISGGLALLLGGPLARAVKKRLPKPKTIGGKCLLGAGYAVALLILGMLIHLVARIIIPDGEWLDHIPNIVFLFFPFSFAFHEAPKPTESEEI